SSPGGNPTGRCAATLICPATSDTPRRPARRTGRRRRRPRPRRRACRGRRAARSCRTVLGVLALPVGERAVERVRGPPRLVGPWRPPRLLHAPGAGDLLDALDPLV